MKSWNGLESLEARTLFSAGAIDTSFGKNGIVTGQANVTLNDVPSFQPTSIAQQSNGKLILAGGDRHDLFIARTDSHGNLDTSFGSDGVATIHFANYDAWLGAIAIDTNNRIVIAGTIEDSDGYTQFAVARLTANGKLDTHFGKNGEATVYFYPSYSSASALTIDSHGRILVAGTSDGDGSEEEMAVARFTPNGHLDSEFSLDGKQTINVSGGSNSANAIAVRPDGSVLLAGYSASQTASVADMTVVSLTPAGQLDHSFSKNGVATISFGPDDSQATAILLQSDNKIVLAGGDFDENNVLISPLMARLLPNGSLDTTFSHDGKLSPKEWPVSLESPTQILRGPDGYYRVYDQNSESRVSFGGKENLSFGTKGVQTILDSNGDVFLAKPDDSLIAVTTLNDDSIYPAPVLDIVWINADGNFSSSAQVIFDQGNASLAIDPSGNLLATAPASGLFAVYRFKPDGATDSTFGDHGRSVIASEDSEGSVQAAKIIATGEGRFILDGSGNDNQDPDFTAIIMARGNADGSVDPNYPDETSEDFSGFQDETEDGNVQLLPHGYVFASQNNEDPETNEIVGFLIAPDGQVTTAGDYDDNQIGSGTQVNDIIPFRDTGAILVAYDAQNKVPDANGDYVDTASASYLQKVGPNASSFGNNGILKGSYDLLDAQPGGKILYIDDTTDGLRRLNANGTPDSTFGTHGLAAAGYGSFTVDSHNRIIAYKTRKDGSIQIARFTLNGQPDKSFNGNGQVIVHSPISNGSTNLLITPNDDLVLTALNQSGSTVKWSAIRIKGS